ncbi:hypothetical protein WN51_11499 [Melipona quadrifasciata]|uniref:Uncharacterized protein n=1 Tax=Melipona quadrifasciata TaxID=166423 RepID=A0A0N0BK00_9HYME|nr:hypothetical protein WN51_11499 [Melipona quadrifasciata]
METECRKRMSCGEKREGGDPGIFKRFKYNDNDMPTFTEENASHEFYRNKTVTSLCV